MFFVGLGKVDGVEQRQHVLEFRRDGGSFLPGSEACREVLAYCLDGGERSGGG